ncbi:MAG TPA: S66 peptidase family protein [Fimbriimonadaceae bacterium]|nr:S66 peptidase family protein [Fimbriimonadaceae bacterium]
MRKPPRLRPGDTVATLSPSWGGPSRYPLVYELGLRNLERLFGLKIKEYPTARMADEELYFNPKRRAEDINAAFADPEVGGIIASIGGSESVRILPFLDLDAIKAHPKILMGYSDTTTLTTTLNQAGLVTFNGPSVMAGFAQMRHLPGAFAEHVKSMLMEPAETYEFSPYSGWADRYVDWTTAGYDGEVAPLQAHDGWRWIQGEGVHEGVLFGGCIEVLEFLKATPWWPAPEFWEGKILFLETSEEKPEVRNVEYMLRNYGSIGALDRLSGLLVGRARSYTPEEKESLYAMLPRVVGFEFGRKELPIVANLDFGHTDPQFVMPLGIRIQLDCEAKRLRLLEPAVG